MIGAVLEIILHPVNGTIRATRTWPANRCHVRSLVALIVLGLMTAGGASLWLRVLKFPTYIVADSVEVSIVLPFLAGCGLAGAMVLLGGTFVRFLTLAEWDRAIDENQYVRLMAAAMWAMVPVGLAGVVIGGVLGYSLGRPAAVLVTVPICLASGFATVTWRVVQNLYRRELGERLCDRCGYLLRYLTIPRCPECGEVFPAEWLNVADFPIPESLPTTPRAKPVLSDPA